MTNVAFRMGLVFSVCGLLSVPAEAQTIGGAMVSFLDSRVGTQIGGGRSSHLAIEALRVAGGEFYPGDLGADSPGSGDRVWGTLVTVISNSNNSWSDSAPDAAVQPGDVIQYCGGVILGNAAYREHFTSVVQSVNSANRPATVYQQNFGDNPSVQVASIDTTNLVAGSLYIYRPINRIDAPNVWKFTVVNNTSKTQTYSVQVDINTVNRVTGNGGSLISLKVETDGTVPAVVADTAYIYVENAKANEMYGSFVALRQLSP